MWNPKGMADCTVLTVVPNLLLLGAPENQQPFGPSFFSPLFVVLYEYFMDESGFFVCSPQLTPQS